MHSSQKKDEFDKAHLESHTSDISDRDQDVVKQHKIALTRGSRDKTNKNVPKTTATHAETNENTLLLPFSTLISSLLFIITIFKLLLMYASSNAWLRPVPHETDTRHTSEHLDTTPLSSRGFSSSLVFDIISDRISSLERRVVNAIGNWEIINIKVKLYQDAFVNEDKLFNGAPQELDANASSGLTRHEYFLYTFQLSVFTTVATKQRVVSFIHNNGFPDNMWHSVVIKSQPVNTVNVFLPDLFSITRKNAVTSVLRPSVIQPLKAGQTLYLLSLGILLLALLLTVILIVASFVFDVLTRHRPKPDKKYHSPSMGLNSREPSSAVAHQNHSGDLTPCNETFAAEVDRNRQWGMKWIPTIVLCTFLTSHLAVLDMFVIYLILFQALIGGLMPVFVSLLLTVPTADEDTAATMTRRGQLLVVPFHNTDIRQRPRSLLHHEFDSKRHVYPIPHSMSQQTNMTSAYLLNEESYDIWTTNDETLSPWDLFRGGYVGLYIQRSPHNDDALHGINLAEVNDQGSGLSQNGDVYAFFSLGRGGVTLVLLCGLMLLCFLLSFVLMLVSRRTSSTQLSQRDNKSSDHTARFALRKKNSIFSPSRQGMLQWCVEERKDVDQDSCFDEDGMGIVNSQCRYKTHGDDVFQVNDSGNSAPRGSFSDTNYYYYQHYENQRPRLPQQQSFEMIPLPVAAQDQDVTESHAEKKGGTLGTFSRFFSSFSRLASFRHQSTSHKRENGGNQKLPPTASTGDKGSSPINSETHEIFQSRLSSDIQYTVAYSSKSSPS